MKKLLIGNEAVARGLYEGGINVVSSYPGTPSTEITEFLSKYDDIHSEWAPNEKVAMEVAFGASLGGARSACAMKHVGLNVAADPLFTLSYTGVTGGMVICVADDPAMHSSQNEQDSRHYAIAAKVPMLEPADSSESYEFARDAFELSEKFDTPVILRMCTRISHSQSIVEIGERNAVPVKAYEKNIPKYVMMPGNAKKRHPIVEERTKAIAEFAENCKYNRIEMGGTEIGIITAGDCYQYVKEALGDSVSVLKLGIVNPLPVNLIKDFAAKVKRLIVVEELDGIIEAHVRGIGLAVEGKSLFGPLGEFNQEIVKNVILGEKCRTLWGADYITDILCGLKFRISPLSFYQVNRSQAERLYGRAAEYADLTGKEIVLDLYCGAGTIGLSMASKAKEIIGVEIVPEAIEDAKINAKINGVKNARFICGDAAQAAEILKNEGVKPDVIILDPPRKGCSPEMIETAAEMQPERIVYVSCDPATLARDCGIFADLGYIAVKATPVDMFPRSGHVETVCLLSKLNTKHHIEIDLDMDELNLTDAEKKATYQEIKDYVLEHSGLKVSSLYIAQVKQKCGIIERDCYNKPKSEDARQPKCPPNKEKAIKEALKHFGMIK